jgi:hypothetical protein
MVAMLPTAVAALAIEWFLMLISMLQCCPRVTPHLPLLCVLFDAIVDLISCIWWWVFGGGYVFVLCVAMLPMGNAALAIANPLLRA